jgi:DNA-binding GntR family transcriptional regulator
MTGLPQLKAVSIRASVTEAIRKAMLDGRLRPGQPLSEAALAAQMSVSRGPVREALFTLAKEGLVTHSQNYGFSVVEFTEQDLIEVQQVRLPLEVLALELARAKVSESDVTLLRRLRDEIADSFRRQQFPACTQADLSFHKHIWTLSGNNRLLESLSNLLVPYFAYGSAFRISRPDLSSELLYDQHESYISVLLGERLRPTEEYVRMHVGP